MPGRAERGEYDLATEAEEGGSLGRLSEAGNALRELLEPVERVEALIKEVLGLLRLREGHDLHRERRKPREESNGGKRGNKSQERSTGPRRDP